MSMTHPDCKAYESILASVVAHVSAALGSDLEVTLDEASILYTTEAGVVHGDNLHTYGLFAIVPLNESAQNSPARVTVTQVPSRWDPKDQPVRYPAQWDEEAFEWTEPEKMKAGDVLFCVGNVLHMTPDAARAVPNVLGGSRAERRVLFLSFSVKLTGSLAAPVNSELSLYWWMWLQGYQPSPATKCLICVDADTTLPVDVLYAGKEYTDIPVHLLSVVRPRERHLTTVVPPAVVGVKVVDDDHKGAGCAGVHLARNVFKEDYHKAQMESVRKGGVWQRVSNLRSFKVCQ